MASQRKPGEGKTSNMFAVAAKDSRSGRQGFLSVSLGLEHLAPTVETVGADVVPQVRFAGVRLDGDTRFIQGVVSTVHTALGGRLLVLLDGHG
jgi:hypothetical protein